ATKDIDTRVPNGPSNGDDVVGPLQGSPQPWLFTAVKRTMAIDTKSIGDPREFDSVSLKTIDQASTPIPAQSFNVLAMAAPHLESKTADTAALPVVEDLFNTFVAGFRLARQDASVAHPLINTGAIGAGDFNNNRDVVFVLQDLAARYTGVN